MMLETCVEDDFVENPGLASGEVILLDGAVGFDTFERVRCGDQLSEAALKLEPLLQGSMTPFDAIVQVFATT